MNNVNMGGMNTMGGPVGGGMPAGMNNGAGVRPQILGNENQRTQLNTYIYEYFLRNEMYDCARTLLMNEQSNINIIKDSPGRRRENGAGDEGGDGESKDDVDSKRPSDLPDPAVPQDCPESCFLYEWWCLFWDMFNAQRGKGEGRNVLTYSQHTQLQSRNKQEAQQQMLRQVARGNFAPGQLEQIQMMQRQQNGMPMNANELRKNAIQNNRNTTPQQQMMLQKHQAMQRDLSDGNNQQRPQSPGSAENAPSPSKRPRLDGTPSFNPQQMPNGRPAAMPQQFQNIPGGNPNANARVGAVGAYNANMAQQQAQQAQMKPMPNAGGPQNQGSPMMNQVQEGGAIANYYNPGDIGPNGIRGGPGGQPGGSGGNHALQDYQMQLMLLEQQNKKRLMMARQEQDNMAPRADGQGGPGPNGQPFQGTSPQGGPRNSPNPGDQMKRGTPHMNNAGMPSPLPEGQSRGSPSNGMNFNLPGGPMDPTMNPQYFNKMDGMNPSMVPGMNPGMRPPSSHPGGAFNQMTQQQMAMARQHQQQQQQVAQGQWPAGGPNGQMIQQPNAQGPPQQQNMGTPQQRNMAPPAVPAAGAAANGRATSSPQQNPAPPTPSQTNKPNPKKKAATESKDAKTKRAAKKGSNANLNAGATPSADADASAATPTPQTPITPIHKQSFNNGPNGAVQPVANVSQPAPNGNAVMPQQTPVFSMDNGGFENFGSNNGMDFVDPANGLDVLQDFDFDSFLHQDDNVGEFNFDTSFQIDSNEIGAD